MPKDEIPAYRPKQPGPDATFRAVTEIATVGEIMTLDEAKAHLGITDTRHDTQITQLITEARDYCERYVDRTFRTDVTRELVHDEWPPGHVDLYSPPLKSVTGIDYIDDADAPQTLDPTWYSVLLSTDTQGRIAWTGLFEEPALADREDAITITYVSGYAAVPPSAVAAAKLQLSLLWDNDEAPAILSVYADRCNSLLDGLRWGSYA